MDFHLTHTVLHRFQQQEDNHKLLLEVLSQLIQLKAQVTTMSVASDRLNADIAKQTTIIAGFGAAMSGMAQQLRDLAAASAVDGATAAQLNTMADEIEANNEAASAALIANITAAPPSDAPPSSPPAIPAA